MISRIKILAVILYISINICHAQQTIQLEPFTRIVIRNAANITIKLGSENQILLPQSADISQFKWNFKGDALIIEGRPQDVTIVAKQIAEIDVQGAGSLTVVDTLIVPNLLLTISGTGSLVAPVVTENLKADISGIGSVTFSGSANVVNIQISGSGKVNAASLKTKNATVDISGTGSATIDVTNNLDASISGSGSVYYVTKPVTLNKSVSGVGRVGLLADKLAADTSRIEMGNMSIDIFNNGKDSVKFFSEPRKANGWWGGVDLGFNGWLSNNGNDTPDGYDFLELIPEKSIAINLNLAEFNWGLIKSKKHLLVATTGVGLSYNNYRFRKDISLNPDTSALWYTTDSINYKKNKLTVSYLTVPVLLTYNSHKFVKKAFHVTTGFLFSYKIGSHTKRVYEIDNEKKKDKTWDDFNINPFKTDVTLRVGYREATVFVNYALSNFLKNNKGPELHPWSFGLALVGW